MIDINRPKGLGKETHHFKEYIKGYGWHEVPIASKLCCINKIKSHNEASSRSRQKQQQIFEAKMIDDDLKFDVALFLLSHCFKQQIANDAQASACFVRTPTQASLR